MAGNYDKRQLLKTAYNYTQDGQWDRALREYQTISRLFPNDANIHSMVADIFARRGKEEDAVREYLEAARLQREQDQYEKEMNTLKKILRIFPGHSDATAAIEKNMEKRLARARSLFGQEKFDEAEQACQDLLDVDPGSLGVNRLLDDIRAERIRRESAQAELKQQEKDQKEVETKKQDVGERATREVLSRLETTADQYLAAGDFDNAIETMLIMLKIDPGMTEVRELLEETQRLLEKRKRAHDVWVDVQTAPVRAVDEVKTTQAQAQSEEIWKLQEQELKSRMDAEREAVEQAQAHEQEIIKRAVAEMEAQKAEEEAPAAKPASLPPLSAPQPPAPPRVPPQAPPQVPLTSPASLPTDSKPADPGSFEVATPAVGQPLASEASASSWSADLDAKDLMALAKKRADARGAVDARNLASRLERDAEATQAKFAVSPQGDQLGPGLDAGFRADNEMLEHAIEMERHEAAAKAHENSVKELEDELKKVREDSEQRLKEEHEHFARQELELRRQMRELMAEEMAKVKAEVREKAMEDVQKQLAKEQEGRRQREEEEKIQREKREGELRAKQDLEKRLRGEAEKKIMGERRAIEHLQKYHDERKKDFVAQAKHRREEREKGSREGKKVQRSSRQISDAIRAAATKHISQDLSAMLDTANRYLKQNLLLDAMKMCQKITEADPSNEDVKELLKEIYVRKGL